MPEFKREYPCSSLSRLKLADPLSKRCAHCGHVDCWPGYPCDWCKLFTHLDGLAGEGLRDA